jgi:hypothetical protein
VAVTPAALSTYALECVGPGGTASASVTIDVTTPPAGSNPTLGAHSLVFHISKGSVGATLPTPAMTTQSGSTLLAFVGKGSVWNLSLPFDNKGNTPYVQIGAIHEYTNWPGEGTAVYAFNSIVGGANHIVSVDDSNVWDEVSFALVEVKNGGVIQDYKWNEVLKPNALTSQSVTTTGPATLVAVWFGDDSSSTPSNPVPNNGFTVIEGNGNATESVQMYVATKDVAAAGTYNVTWNTTPIQGAQLYLIAVQKPQCSATKPSSGGPSRNATKEICASAATLVAAGRSVRWAAADMASGKMALVPMPMMPKPNSAAAPEGATNTSSAPAPSTSSSTRATTTGLWRSTKRSAKNRVTAWVKAPMATAEPATKGAAPNTSRM